MPEKKRAAVQAAGNPPLSKDAVLGELAKLGFANIHDYLRLEGGGATVDLSRLTRDHAAAITEITVTTRQERTKEDRPPAEITNVKFKLADKRQALQAIGKHLGLFNDEPAMQDAGTNRPDFADPRARLEFARQILFLIAEVKKMARRDVAKSPEAQLTPQSFRDVTIRVEDARHRAGARAPKSPRHEIRMSRGIRVIWVAFAVVLTATIPAHTRDLGQWDNADPRIRAWYKNLKQPNNPAISCCGEADAYWADEFEVAGYQYVAIVTDTRDDGALRRTHVAPGTRILIPRDKLVHEHGNPTGHGLVFYTQAQASCTAT